MPSANDKSSSQETSFNLTRGMINASTDVNKPDENGHTLLMRAVLAENEELVRLLIARGARLNDKGIQGKTALMQAVSAGSAQIARILIEAKADVNFENKQDETALKLAIINDQTELARMLVEAGAGIDVKDSHGNTPLVHAAVWGRPDIVQLLLDKNHLDKKEEQRQMQSALFHTIKPEVVKKLIAHGVSVKDAPGALIKASAAGYTEIARLLLDNGANPNETDNAGRPVLMAALDGYHMDIAELLAAKGAFLDAKDRSAGHTALVYAAARGRIRILQWLLDKGAAVDEANTFGVTALLCAARNKQDECIRLLIDRGADMDRVSDGRTVFDMAKLSGKPETLQLLRDIAAEKKAQAERLDEAEKARAAHATAVAKQKRLNRLGKKLRFGS